MFQKWPFILCLALLWAACRPNTANNSMQNSTLRPQSLSLTEPDWAKNAVLYACFVRQFSAQGNLAGVQAQLPRLRELGMDVLWLMPIQPLGKLHRKGRVGSSYCIQDYKAVNPEYGRLEDVQNLVQEAHQLGLKVILDWVPNHTAWDAVWMKEHPEFYTKINGQFTAPLNENGQPTGWDDVAELDYSQPGLWYAMIDAMQYWIKTCDIDGYRVDMAGLVPNDFWKMVRPALDSIKPVFMLAEWQDDPAHFSSCFNANYGWKWKDVTRDIAAGRQNALALDSLLLNLDAFYPPGYYQIYFTQNHDENWWSGTDAELFGPATDAMQVLMFTWQGMPLVFNGQEDRLNQRLSLFEKDPIRWGNMEKTRFFQNLCSLKHNNKALQTGRSGGPLHKIPTSNDAAVYAFSREQAGDRVVVVINLSKEPCNFTLQPPNELIGGYLNVFEPSTVQLTRDMRMNLGPWEYLVLTNK